MPLQSRSLFSIQIFGLKELRKSLEAKQRRVTIVIKEMRKLAYAIARNVRAAAPKKTGALVKSITTKAISPFEYHIIEKKSYGILQRSGIKRTGYEIYPKKKKALYWEGLSHPIAKVPHHPGFAANPYHVIGLEASQADISRATELLANQLTIDITATK